MTTILVIEDEEPIRENLLEFLHAEGFAAIGAENGAIGIQKVQDHQPDLVICDVMMPELDGYDVLTALRQNPATAMIPFLFLTSKSNQMDFRQGMSLGADDYITKPCNLQDLLDAIETRLQKQRAVRHLQQQVEALEQQHEVKNEFLTAISHDLRAPLANMTMVIQMLKLAPTPQQQNKYLEILQAECTRETALVNDLLALQQVEGTHYPVSRQLVNLDDWLPELTAGFHARMNDYRQVFKVHLQPEVPPICTDTSILGRILTELLNNACKYTPAGGEIMLQVGYGGVIACDRSSRAGLISSTSSRSGGLASGSSKFRLVIRNQAEIPQTELPRIFEPFYRIPKGDPMRRGGTGLGLTLVQKFVERLQGTIQVSSDNGWTSFMIELPDLPCCVSHLEAC